MNKFKKIWRLGSHKLRSYSLKKRWLIIGTGIMLFLLLISGLYYGIALARVSRAEVYLAALRESIINEKVCHEQCMSTRKLKENLIIKAIKNSDRRLLKRLEKYWLSSEESFEFKKELVNLWRLNNEPAKIPKYYFDYLDSEQGDIKLQALIIGNYLSSDQSKRWIDYYFNLLVSNRNVALKKEALLALSNRQDKASDFKVKQLSLLRKLIFDKSAPQAIKADIVLLIGDYYEIFPADTEVVLREIYMSSDIDNISKSFAVEILNKYRVKSKLSAPEITEEEWAAYYKN